MAVFGPFFVHVVGVRTGGPLRVTSQLLRGVGWAKNVNDAAFHEWYFSTTL